MIAAIWSKDFSMYLQKRRGDFTNVYILKSVLEGKIFIAGNTVVFSFCYVSRNNTEMLMHLLSLIQGEGHLMIAVTVRWRTKQLLIWHY